MPQIRDNRRTRSVVAFTLVELLVIIAVLMLLMSLLLPALRGTLARARLLQCMNNLRQQSAAIFTYARDYGGYVPRDYWYDDHLKGPFPNAVATAPHALWAELILPYVGGREAPQPGHPMFRYDADRDRYLAALLLGMRLFKCPAMPPSNRPAVTVRHPYTNEQFQISESVLDYVINAVEFWPVKDDAAPLSKLGHIHAAIRPTQIIYLTEVYQDPALVFMGHRDVFSTVHLWNGAGPRMINDTRHGGRCAVSYFDGRAEIREIEKLSWADFRGP